MFNKPNNYKGLSAKELRKMLLNNTIEAISMGLEEYEKLFEYEIGLEEPDFTVIKFCNKGLAQYKEYNDDIQKPPFERVLQKYNEQKAKPVNRRRKTRKAVLIAAALIATMLIAQLVAVAMGYESIIDMGKRIINIPEKTATDLNGKDIGRSDDFRIFNSIDEILKTENIHFLYPEKLPFGYEFTNFEATDMGDYSEIRVYATEPYIDFRVGIGANIIIDNYTHEANGTEYNIFDMGGGLYQACWVYNADYYTIVVADEAILSEIIENLKES